MSLASGAYPSRAVDEAGFAAVPRSGGAGLWPSLAKCLLFALSALCVVTCNTLWGNLPSMRNSLPVATLAVAAACALVLWARVGVDRRALGWAVVWGALVALCYAAIGASAGDLGGRRPFAFFGMLVLAPLLVVLLRGSGLLGFLTGTYIALMGLLAASSLAIWLAGPILGIVQPNCAIENEWNGVSGLVLQTPGYFNLLYTPQTSGDYSLIPGIVRNTSIFTEAPMFSFALCTALLLEALGRERPRAWLVVLLLAAIVSTNSTTGIVVAVCAVLGRWCLGAVERGRVRPLRALALVVLAVAAVLFLQALLSLKMGGSSASIRLDDFAAGLQAWSDNWLFGNGLSGGEAIEGYMGRWRSYNTGFSNSLMDVLARGGLAFLLPCLLAFGGFFQGCGPRAAVFALVYIAMWVFTIVTFLPLNALVLSYGASRLIAPEPAEACAAARRRGHARESFS